MVELSVALKVRLATLTPRGAGAVAVLVGLGVDRDLVDGAGPTAAGGDAHAAASHRRGQRQHQGVDGLVRVGGDRVRARGGNPRVQDIGFNLQGRHGAAAVVPDVVLGDRSADGSADADAGTDAEAGGHGDDLGGDDGLVNGFQRHRRLAVEIAGRDVGVVLADDDVGGGGAGTADGATEGADTDADGQRRGGRGRRDLRLSVDVREIPPLVVVTPWVTLAMYDSTSLSIVLLASETPIETDTAAPPATEAASATEATLATMVEVSIALKVTLATLTPAPVPAPFW